MRVPCAYQGGKQRIAGQIVDILMESACPNTSFFDICCGSGAISIELVNRGVSPSRITMLDASSWGSFWSAIGTGRFSMDRFDRLLSELPSDKRKVKAHMLALSALPLRDNEPELYLLLQACSFGGKQIYRDGERWANAFFRDFWEPTQFSVRRSPANPMQPSPDELRRRVSGLVQGMKGVTCKHSDITALLEHSVSADAVVYIDPPYESTTAYAFDFDLDKFITDFRKAQDAVLFVSEAVPLSPNALRLSPTGANGGISGMRREKHQEWLSRL